MSDELIVIVACFSVVAVLVGLYGGLAGAHSDLYLVFTIWAMMALTMIIWSGAKLRIVIRTATAIPATVMTAVLGMKIAEIYFSPNFIAVKLAVVLNMATNGGVTYLVGYKMKNYLLIPKMADVLYYVMTDILFATLITGGYLLNTN